MPFFIHSLLNREVNGITNKENRDGTHILHDPCLLCQLLLLPLQVPATTGKVHQIWFVGSVWGSQRGVEQCCLIVDQCRWWWWWWAQSGGGGGGACAPPLTTADGGVKPAQATYVGLSRCPTAQSASRQSRRKHAPPAPSLPERAPQVPLCLQNRIHNAADSVNLIGLGPAGRVQAGVHNKHSG